MRCAHTGTGLTRGSDWSFDCWVDRRPSPSGPPAEPEATALALGRRGRDGVAVRPECRDAEPHELLGRRRAGRAQDDRYALVDRLEIEERVVRQVGRDPRSERRLDV